jgi:hypothetical protein
MAVQAPYPAYKKSGPAGIKKHAIKAKTPTISDEDFLNS